MNTVCLQGGKGMGKFIEIRIPKYYIYDATQDLIRSLTNSGSRKARNSIFFQTIELFRASSSNTLRELAWSFIELHTKNHLGSCLTFDQKCSEDWFRREKLSKEQGARLKAKNLGGSLRQYALKQEVSFLRQLSRNVEIEAISTFVWVDSFNEEVRLHGY